MKCTIFIKSLHVPASFFFNMIFLWIQISNWDMRNNGFLCQKKTEYRRPRAEVNGFCSRKDGKSAARRANCPLPLPPSLPYRARGDWRGSEARAFERPLKSYSHGTIHVQWSRESTYMYHLTFEYQCQNFDIYGNWASKIFTELCF